MRNQTEMDNLTTELAEWICDSVCYKPKVIVDEKELTDHCSKCEIGKHVVRIINGKE